MKEKKDGSTSITMKEREPKYIKGINIKTDE
jgi:hypothetical protein